jgi:hypothetical protein
MSKITPTHAEKMEWARMAQAAYAIGRNDIGHRYSAAASLRNGDWIPVRMFDGLQTDYRAWLVFGEWPQQVSA